MATRFYLSQGAAPYAPATFKGAWTRTSNAVNRCLSLDRAVISGPVTAAKTPTQSDGFAECLARFVTDPLPPGAVTGATLDYALRLMEGNAGDNAYLRLHCYVTQGDSDLARATLLSDYAHPVEASATQVAAQQPSPAVALGDVTIQAGDRLVLEVGYALAAPTAAATVTFYYDGSPMQPDAVAGDFGQQPSWIEVAGLPSAVNVSQVVAEGVVAGAPSARVSQLVAEGVVAGASAARVSQMVVEAVYSSVVTARTRARILA